MMSFEAILRINKYLALSGIASRRKCDEFIQQGLVSVNETIVHELGISVQPGEDRVDFKGKEVHLPVEFSYYMLNKPKGYLTSQSDPQNRKTIDSFIEKIKERLFHVGRLDKESEGLLLFTNDGDLAYRLLHPKYHVPKIYLVKVDAFLPDEKIETLMNGIELKEGMTSQSEIILIERSHRLTTFNMTLRQGWKRQIRRMLKAIGFEVVYLKRETFGNLELSDLKSGELRQLSCDEISSLKRLANGS